MAATAATAPFITGQPSREAFHALTAFASRIKPHRFDQVARLAEPHLERETSLTEPPSRSCVGFTAGFPRAAAT
jgi:hypothetical protein